MAAAPVPSANPADADPARVVTAKATGTGAAVTPEGAPGGAPGGPPSTTVALSAPSRLPASRAASTPGAAASSGTSPEELPNAPHPATRSAKQNEQRRR